MHRCSKEVECKAYQYKETLVENCLLIDTSMSDSGVTFFVHQDTAIYKKGNEVDEWEQLISIFLDWVLLLLK